MHEEDSTNLSVGILLKFQDLNNVKISSNHYIISVENCPEQITIPEGIKGLGKSCFSGERNLRVISLPNKIEFIDDYVFANCINLEEITQSIEVKQKFLGRNLDKFDIHYVIGDSVETISCPVGEYPILPDEITLPETEEHFYVFDGWDRELEIVSKETTYTATFVEKNKYLITWVIDGNSISIRSKEGEKPIEPIDVTKADGESYYYIFSLK